MRDYQSKANKGGVADSINAEYFGAGEFNSIAVELENAVSTSDQTLAPADGTGEVLTQLAMALAIYGAGGAAYHLDTGAVNAYVLNPVSPKESPPDYFDGFTVSFMPGTPNTGASTVNVNAIGLKSITLIDGSALTGGEINGNVIIRYSLSNDRFEIIRSGMAKDLIVFTASGTYDKPTGLKFIEVKAVGGGGGGGGVAGATASDFGAGGGGGAGGCAIITIYASALSASETVTVGAGGTGGIGSLSGSSGGNTTFGAHCTGGGGTGGGGHTSSANAKTRFGGQGGTATGGDINITGGPGGIGVAVDSASLGANGGPGGSSVMGGGAYSSSGDINGNNATGYGGGGGGAVDTGSTSTFNGGDGADGLIIVKEYF